jgi:hypothetical protein
MASDDNKTIKQLASIQRPAYGDKKAEELRVELCSYAGKPYVSVRLWFMGNSGEMLPSKKGLSIRMGEVAAVVQALRDPEVVKLAVPPPGKPQAAAKPRLSPGRPPVAEGELFEGEGTNPPADDPF